MAQEMQYCNFTKSFGKTSKLNALESLISLLEEASTISRTVYLLIALSLPTNRWQLEQVVGTVLPLFFFDLPLFLLFDGINQDLTLFYQNSANYQFNAILIQFSINLLQSNI